VLYCGWLLLLPLLLLQMNWLFLPLQLESNQLILLSTISQGPNRV
jgi:hypothetical protein